MDFAIKSENSFDAKMNPNDIIFVLLENYSQFLL